MFFFLIFYFHCSFTFNSLLGILALRWLAFLSVGFIYFIFAFFISLRNIQPVLY